MPSAFIRSFKCWVREESAPRRNKTGIPAKSEIPNT